MHQFAGRCRTFKAVNTTLYEVLAAPAREDRSQSGDRGRTERTAKVETMDRDRATIDLYANLGVGVTGDGPADGRTEETKTIETIDKDRVLMSRTCALHAPVDDLYAALATNPAVGRGGGRTEITEATETLDWDRPPGR